uniref:Uncharacterized protein n=2 Tax=Trieres chinensis TaxID=1514140 RepID=A0A7S2ET39_TRICV|mmetsp:Transcript_37240/g.75891  ORF Transcript_37240/g.75891 Transcript_37240/m.75891 type:complete len:210 (+) Transcript_37240:114-743(+)
MRLVNDFLEGWDRADSCAAFSTTTLCGTSDVVVREEESPEELPAGVGSAGSMTAEQQDQSSVNADRQDEEEDRRTANEDCQAEEQYRIPVSLDKRRSEPLTVWSSAIETISRRIRSADETPESPREDFETHGNGDPETSDPDCVQTDDDFPERDEDPESEEKDTDTREDRDPAPVAHINIDFPFTMISSKAAEWESDLLCRHKDELSPV